MPDITEALDRLRADDPARDLDPLSAVDRAMIRDRIVAGVSPSHQDGPARAPRRRRLRTTASRGRALIALGAVLVGGGVATAAIVGRGTTTLVAHGLSCISGVNNDATSAAYGVAQSGDSPTAACAPVIGVPATKLVACSKADEGIVVYEADTDSVNQCKSLGLAPLPANYASAITQIHALERALTADYDSSDCVSPGRLARDAGAELQRLGFIGWHAVIDRGGADGAQYGGSCGEFPATAASISTADAALDADDQTVTIEIGAPRSSLRLAERIDGPMIDASGDRCYTLAGAQQLVRNMLDRAAGRGHTVPVKFAVTREPANTTMSGGSGGDGRQTYYRRGCTIVAGTGTAADGRTFMVLLMNKAGGPAQNTGTSADPPPRWGAPASAFKSDLTRG